MTNHFRLIGRVYGNPKVEERLVDGKKVKGLVFYLCDVDKNASIYELKLPTRLFERGSMFLRNGNFVAVTGIICSNWHPPYKKTRRYKNILFVTEFQMLVKAKNTENKDYTSVLSLYPQIDNADEERW